jgi:hypothetical protein
VVDAEQRLRPLLGQHLDRVDELLALVVAAARIALGVLVGQHRPGRLKHRLGDVVLRRDQADLLELPARLGLDEPGDLRVGLCDVRNGGLVHGDLLGKRLHTRARAPGGAFR